MKFIAVYDKDATEYESDRLGFLERCKRCNVLNSQ